MFNDRLLCNRFISKYLNGIIRHVAYFYFSEMNYLKRLSRYQIQRELINYENKFCKKHNALHPMCAMRIGIPT